MISLILRWILAIVIAFAIGKLVSKFKLPSILGWLIGGMLLGPYAFSLIPNDLLNAGWYQNIIHVLECAVGLMIGTELVWKRMKKYGKGLIITTLTQSLGTFILVSAVFSIVFIISGIPVYLAFLFGGIALATAPAPALSIVREFKADGPVTKTLIPMAALDDMVGVAVFFTTIAIVARSVSGTAMPIWMIPVMIFLPLIIGAIIGIPTGFMLKKGYNKSITLTILIAMILATAGIGFICNTYLMPSPMLNFMLMGMAFSAAFSNIVPEAQLEKMISDFNPILGISMIIVILNLGTPLDYHAILGAGLFTFIYIVFRGCGKYFGAQIGAKAMKMPVSVQKYLGLTLLPHSGVSLVFTGIAVSVLSSDAPEYAKIIQGTIAAAAVINEVIAVIIAKKGFEWAGELHKEEYEKNKGIKYRPIEERDYLAVGEIINQSFGLYRYVSNEKTLKCFKNQYVYSCLSETTYTQVAEQDGKVVGVIMGNAKSDYKLLPHLKYAFRTTQYRIKMKYYGRKFKSGIEDYKRMHKIYHSFSNKHKDEFDGVLTLFAVNEKCRGLGVGKVLLTGLLEYLKQQKTNRIYLYTDTTCNYGFYEHQGFERLEEQPLSLTKDGQQFDMDVFLYSFDLNA